VDFDDTLQASSSSIVIEGINHAVNTSPFTSQRSNVKVSVGIFCVR